MTRSPTDAEVSTSGQPAKLLSGGDQQHTQTQHSAHTEGNAADPEQPSRKRRKHFGVRYGAPVAASQQPLPDRVSEPKQHQQKQTINHHQVQRAKAEAQLQGRKFHLDTSSCALPNRDQLFISRAWSLPDMMTEKKKLNDTKNLLDCKDIKPWGSHTAFTNRAGNVVRQIRQGQGEVELCTTAWAKMYESIVSFDLLPVSGSAALGRLETGQPAVGSVHLCEAPGAFISATNHYIRTHRPDWHWEWIGNSLHPYYEGNDPAAMIDDDALIQGTLQHWHWGDDGSGDIRRPDNVAAICQSAAAMAGDLHTGGALLVTADGSVDCQENPNEQEMSTASLHFCEMVTALGVLSPGGSFILKAFTPFEHPTICALYLMGSLFHQVHVYKPATSKPGNSETYIIGKGFKGIEPELHSFLVSRVGEEVYKDRALLPVEALPAAFLESCTRCAAYFAGIQEQIISDNLAMDQFLPPAQKSALNAAKHWMAQEWPRYFGLKALARDRFLAPAVFLSGSNNNTSNPVHRREKHDGTLAERVALGKRRREQLGIQTDLDMQNSSSAAGQSAGPLPFSHGAPNRALAGPLTGPSGGTGPSGRAAGPAEGMMAKWGYTPGMGLGKDLQGMANKLEATANKGKSGLGLGHTYTLTPTTTPDYSPQPDTAILTNDHAALSFEEMEWWRIMEQRKPAKLLRSKFLPQDDILLALRTAREISQAWHRDRSLNSPDDKVTDLRTSDSKDSSAEGGWDVPLLVQTPKTNNPSPTVNAKSVAPGAVPGSPGAAPNSPEAFCLHQAPCLAPQGVHHSRSFWNMASLDSAFNICSSLAAMQQPHAKLNILDLSVNECGATEYVMTHGGVRIHSAQVMSGAAAQKLQGSCSHVAGTVQALLPSALSAPGDSAMQEASDALRTHVTDGTPAQTELPSPPPTAAVGSAAVAELPDTASLPGSPAADRQELDLKPLQPSPEAAHQADAAAVTHADVTDSTRVQTAAAADQHIGIANPSAAYSLNSYELLKAGLKAAHLVIGSLSLNNGQGTGPIGREISQTKGRTEGQHGEGSGQGMVAALCPQERVMQHEGVMETEYADDYRARLLWECAVALSSLQTGGTFIVQLPDCLTTFTVSMLYLLMRSFSGLSLVKPFTSCACDSSRFLVCFGRLEDDKVGAMWLAEVLRHSEQLSSNGKIVGEFVPPSSYISSQLLEYVTRRNAALASLQTRALRHMKHLRDEGTQPDATQQSQIALSARQQLVLDPQITTPQLPTPPQKSVELLSPPTTPGLGYTPDTTPAANPANTPAATMSQHPSFRLAGSQLHNVEASLGPGSDKSRRQQAEQQPAEAGIVSSALLRGDGSTKRWQGALYNVHPVKGEEYVCELTTDAWPAHLPRPLKLKVVEYVPVRAALQSPKIRPVPALRLVHTKDELALQGFKQYLTGFRGFGKAVSQPKLAVVKTQTYSILLGCQDGDKSATSGVSCWVM